MILTPDNEYAAVLDACVLAPMPLADTLLRCAEEPALFRVLWSKETLVEVHRTLIKFGYTIDQADRRLKQMAIAFPEAEIDFPANLLKSLDDLPDQKDRHVVAAAIHARAHVIVTSNVKHFPSILLEGHDLLVQSPDEFLVHQFHLNSARMLDVLDTQAGAIGQTRSEIMERLSVVLPKFSRVASSE